MFLKYLSDIHRTFLNLYRLLEPRCTARRRRWAHFLAQSETATLETHIRGAALELALRLGGGIGFDFRRFRSRMLAQSVNAK